MTDQKNEEDSQDLLIGCSFTGGDEPCENCPRKITSLYRCGILQDELKQLGKIED